MTAPIQVLIADDHPVFRDGLASLLEPENDFTVVGRAADGLEAVELAVALRPDVVIMDISMPRTGWAGCHPPGPRAGAGGRCPGRHHG